MVWTAPRDWSLGETPDDTLLNAQLRDNLLALRGLNLMSARVYRTSDLSIANDTRVAISWQAASWNVGTMWDVGDPTKFTISISGRYLLLVNAKWATDPDGRRGTGFKINGGSTSYDIQFQAATASKNPTCNGCEIIDLLAGDYLEVYGYHTAGGAILFNSGVDTSFASLTLLATGDGAPAWTEPASWEQGDVLGPHDLNTELRDHLLNLRNFRGEGVKVYLSEDQSVSDSDRLPLAWDTPLSWNVGTLWSDGTKFIAPIHGYYLLSLTLDWLGGATNQAKAVGYRINGTTTAHDLQFQSSDVSNMLCSGQDLIELRTGDELEVYGYQNSGDSASAHGGSEDRTRCSLTLMAVAAL